MARRHIVADRLYGGPDVPATDKVMVTIDGPKIVGVGSASSTTLEAGAQIDDYAGCTILPGLIDAHCHITLPADKRPYEQMNLDPDEMLALIAIRNLRVHLSSGVTTLRDNGGRNRVTFVVREAINRGYVSGPRLLLSGRPLTHSYGHFYFCNGVADGEVEIRAAVRRLVAEGADHIKIMASGGATAGNIPYFPSYTAAELRVAVEAAHALGRLTTAHCRAKQSMIYAVEAGLDCIEHAEFLVESDVLETGSGVAAKPGRVEYDRAVTEQILESGAFVSFTLQTGGYDTLVELRTKESQEGLSRSEVELKGVIERYMDGKIGIFSQLFKDGMMGRLVVSSDAGPFDTQFGRMYYGIELAVEAGMTPAQAIDACTRIAADACGVGSLVGSVEPDKEADLLIVRGNPLVDVRTIREPVAVYKAGSRVELPSAA